MKFFSVCILIVLETHVTGLGVRLQVSLRLTAVTVFFAQKQESDSARVSACCFEAIYSLS